MSQLFNFSFQTLAGAPDSAGAINKDQVVYAYTTQSTKTLLVLTNGESRIADNTLATVKSTFGLTSIGSPTAVNKQVVSLGEVLVNDDYITQVFDDTTARRVEMNQPASAPVVFTTAATLTGVVANSFAGEKGYKEFIGSILPVTGTNTFTTLYNTIGVTPTLTYFSGTVQGQGTTQGAWVLDFPGVLTTGNIGSFNTTIQPAAQTSVNNVNPKINYGTIAQVGEPHFANKIVISAWTGSATPAQPTQITLPWDIEIKFFG
jgi:hypothetical protein